MYPGEYNLIGTELSFFTRKLEAQLRFQRIPWRYQFKTEARREALETKAGTHFIPLRPRPTGGYYRTPFLSGHSSMSALVKRPSYRIPRYSDRYALFWRMHSITGLGVSACIHAGATPTMWRGLGLVSARTSRSIDPLIRHLAMRS